MPDAKMRMGQNGMTNHAARTVSDEMPCQASCLVIVQTGLKNRCAMVIANQHMRPIPMVNQRSTGSVIATRTKDVIGPSR